MRSTLATLLLAATAACAHEPLPAPPVPTAHEPLDLPAAFHGTLADEGEVELVLLDPQRYALAHGTGEATAFERGTWERQGDHIALHGERHLAFDIREGGGRLASERGNLRQERLPALLAGTVARDDAGLRFTPCDAGAAVRLRDATGTLSAPAFAEIVASPSADATIAWDVQRLAPQENGCASVEEGLVARAVGHAWRLDVDRRSLRLLRPDHDPVGAPWAPFRWERGAWRYQADTGTQQWTVVLTPGSCSEANAEYGYVAEVTLNGETLHGCAHLGTEWQRLGEPAVD